MDEPAPMASGSTVTLEHAPVATPEGPEAARGMKRKRSGMGKENGHHGHSGQSVGLVKIDPVVFAQYEIHPWFSSPYVLEDTVSSSTDHGRATSRPGVGAPKGSGNGTPRDRRNGTAGRSPDQKEKAKDQRRTSGGQFASKPGAATPSPRASRRKPNANTPALSLSLRNREPTDAAGATAIPALRLKPPDPMPATLDSPGISSSASTAPLDSPQLRAIYEPSYVTSSRVDGDPAGQPPHAASLPMEPSPLSVMASLPSPPAPAITSLAPPVLPLSTPHHQIDEAPSPEPPPNASPRKEVLPTEPHSPPKKSDGTPPRTSGGRFVSDKSVEERQALAATQAAKKAIKAEGQSLKANGLMPPAATTEDGQVEVKRRKGPSRGTSPAPPVPVQPTKLYVCEGCFKYMVSPHLYAQHKKTCTFTHPPGRKVYQRGAHIIWEVDGSSAGLYCQCLSLFGKLFIDHKYIFFDVAGFKFYVLTEATPSFDHVLGFFSKEKVSYDGYNLACIVTFPPYQKRGYGTLLIEFSYELDRHRLGGSTEDEQDVQVAGTPERPLSELGARGYLTFWTGTLIRYFRKVFAARGIPDDMDEVVPPRGGGEEGGVVRRVKGFEGELVKVSPPRPTSSLGLIAATALPSPSAPHHTGTQSQRPRRVRRTGSGTVSVRMRLDEIAKATLLRPDDAAFALVKSGLAPPPGLGTGAEDGSGVGREVVVSPESVEQVAERMNIKRAMVDREYVLL